jgi:AcrR family transcriptional regulator
MTAHVRRGEILDAAWLCFAESGFYATKVDDIAERAGVSKGAVYWHFEGKRDLFLALVDRRCQQVEARLEALDKGIEPRQAIARVSEILLRWAPRLPSQEMPVADLTLEYLAHASRDEDLRLRMTSLYGLVTDALREPIERGIREGVFREIEVEGAVLALIALLDGLVGRKVLDPDLDLERVAHQAEGLLIRGLAAG